MSSAVLDASVLLAHISGERGSEAVPQLAEDALLSAVNLAEIFAKVLERICPTTKPAPPSIAMVSKWCRSTESWPDSQVCCGRLRRVWGFRSAIARASLSHYGKLCPFSRRTGIGQG
jgi:hypothetical protein